MFTKDFSCSKDYGLFPVSSLLKAIHAHYKLSGTKIYNKTKKNILIKLQLGEQKGLVGPRREHGQVRKGRKELKRRGGREGRRDERLWRLDQQ